MDPLTTDNTETQIDSDTAQQPAQQPAQQRRPGSVITIPSSAMTSLKKREQDKGKRAAMAELDGKARAMGFRDHEDLLKHASKNRERTARDRTDDRASRADGKPARTDGTGARADNPRLARERERQLEAQRKLNREAARARKRAKSLEQELQAQKVETQLRVAAARAGVHDVDFAIHVLRKHLSELDHDESTTFDEDTFFSKKLRESHPYLYGTAPEVSRPATTTAAEAAPTRAAPPAQSSATTTLDGMKLSPTDYQKRLSELGFSNPKMGVQPAR
jgi:hypothetical protein